MRVNNRGPGRHAIKFQCVQSTLGPVIGPRDVAMAYLLTILLHHTFGAELDIAPRGAGTLAPRVLIVYEDHAQRRDLRKALIRAGCVVIEAANGDTALTYACRLRPDAVITDVTLHGLDGLGLLQALMLDNIVRKVFVYTSPNDAALLQWARDLGASDSLTTEEDPDTLATLVRAELHEYADVAPALAG